MQVKLQQKTNIDLAIGKEVLSVDPTYFRPTEVDLLIGDPTKAKEKLGWVPEHDLASLVKDMMQGDVTLMKKDVDLLKAGHEILKQVEQFKKNQLHKSRYIIVNNIIE